MTTRLQQLQAERAEVYAAWQAVLRSGQETQHGAAGGQRRIRRAEADVLAKRLETIDAEIARMQPRRVFYPRGR